MQIVTTPDLQKVPAVGATLDALCESARELGGHGCTALVPEEAEEMVGAGEA